VAEISFYHLSSTPLERALPRLLEEAVSKGHRAVVKAPSPERVEALDRALWSFGEASFLAHGSTRDGNPREQPIWLTAEAENPNGATLLVLVEGAEWGAFSSFARLIDLFDGNDAAAVESARALWRRARAQGLSLSYWQETASGWQRKA
jgi:DNA polymerase III subunit chi